MVPNSAISGETTKEDLLLCIEEPSSTPQRRQPKSVHGDSLGRNTSSELFSPAPLTPPQSIQQPKKSPYGLGKLRFQRSHGILGISSLPLVLWAMYTVKMTSDFQHIALSLAVLSTAALGKSAIPLLTQVPKSTVISSTWNIIPPHKEAFRRTIAFVGYLDLRLANELFKSVYFTKSEWQQFSMEEWQSCFATALTIYYLFFFLPRGSFDNGNTWVFIVPMFLGLGIDVYHQAPSTFMSWNNSVVSVDYLLFDVTVSSDCGIHVYTWLS